MSRLLLDDQYEKMPWDLLDNIVFDVGNVLLSFQPKQVLEELFPGDSALEQTIYERVFRSPYWVMLDHGTISVQDAVRAMAAHRPELEAPIAYLMDNWIDLKETIPEGIEALQMAKEKGKKLYVLSNYHDAGFEHVYRKYPFFRLFDGLVVSSRVKLLKPDPAIYRTLIEKFRLDPSRTLFIDDTPQNVEAALMEGWQGFCLNRTGRLHDFITG